MFFRQVVSRKLAETQQRAYLDYCVKAMRKPSCSKNWLLELRHRLVRFMYLRRPTFNIVSRLITFPAARPARSSALIVEHGIYPSPKNAYFLITVVQNSSGVGSTGNDCAVVTSRVPRLPPGARWDHQTR